MINENETTVDSRVYEVSFVFDNKLEEATALEKADALKKSIATVGGSFISEETPYMRELAYEMIRVQNNINVRFNQGYFGWIKFEMPADNVKSLEKSLKEDEQVVRFIVVKTVTENTVYTKRAPVMKAETVAEIAASLGNTDLVGDDVEEAAPVAVEEKPVEPVAEVVSGEETK